MKLPSKRLHLLLYCCALLIICGSVSSLHVVSSGATLHLQQTPVAANAQANATAASGSLKFPVTVVGAKGGFVIGLRKENFSVWEGKQEREINYFSTEELPASIAILIDVSGSVKPRTFEAARYAAARFIQHSNPKNEFLIGEFNDTWRAYSGWRQDAAAAIDALNQRTVAADADRLQAKSKSRGQTALYDACAVVLDELARRPTPRHVLLLITDGQDNQSRLSFSQLRRKLHDTDVMVYGLNITDPGSTGGLDVVGQAILDELATTSGGRAFFPEDKKDKTELNVVMDLIALESRYQYLIGFTPTNAAPAGKWNKVKIKLTPPDESLKKLSVRSREGYFSPTATP